MKKVFGFLAVVALTASLFAIDGNNTDANFDNTLQIQEDATACGGCMVEPDGREDGEG